MISLARRTVLRLLNPWLWAVPPATVLTLSLISLSMGQLQLPFITYKSFGAVNGVLLPSLCLFTLVQLTRKGVDNASAIYLSYASVLACYGVGESINRLWFAHLYISKNGLLTWLWTWAYPAFFLLMNVPLFHALRWREADLAAPLKLLCVTVALYGVFCFSIWRELEYLVTQIPYYLARLTSVIAYAVLMWRAQRA